MRKFKAIPVEEEKIEKILEAAKCSPTAVNRQPQKIYVLKSEEAREKMRSVCRYTFHAPLMLLVCYDETLAWKNPLDNDRCSGEIDAAICCDEMMLTAWELGLGSCWVGYFDPKKVAEVFALPENIKVVSLLPLGYPAESAVPLEGMHDVYRPMEEIVKEL